MTTKRLAPVLFGLVAILSFTLITTTAQETVNDEDCPTENFIDVEAAPENSDFPDPTLSISCDDDTMTIVSNGIPNYEFIRITPGDLRIQDFTVEIPIEPTIADETTDIALLGTVAIAVNGLPIYGPNEGGNLGFGDPMLDDILDFCNGHVGPAGYHLHAAPTCLFDDYESANLVIGYALDGFPILAPYVCADEACDELMEVMSSWQRTSDVIAAWDAHEYIADSGDLDQCNGMFLEDGSYAYFATNSFPYTLACYVGEIELPERPPREQAADGQGDDADERPANGQNGVPPNEEDGDGENRPPRGQDRGN
ncbi:MAG: YHYH protein [Chloroflexota bacterium]